VRLIGFHELFILFDDVTYNPDILIPGADLKMNNYGCAVLAMHAPQ